MYGLSSMIEIKQGYVTVFGQLEFGITVFGKNCYTVVCPMNTAENELSALTVQCVRSVRFGAIEELRRSVELWSAG